MKKCIIDNLLVIAKHRIFGEYFNEIGATTVFDYFAQIICRKVTDYSDNTNLKRTFLMNIFVIISFNICWEKQLSEFDDQRTLFSQSKDFAQLNFLCNLVVDNLTALLPLMDCHHLINIPPLSCTVIATGQSV